MGESDSEPFGGFEDETEDYNNGGGISPESDWLTKLIDVATVVTPATMLINAITKFTTGSTVGAHIENMVREMEASGATPTQIAETVANEYPEEFGGDGRNELMAEARNIEEGTPTALSTGQDQTATGAVESNLTGNWLDDTGTILDMVASRQLPGIELADWASIAPRNYGKNNAGSSYLMKIASDLFGSTAPHRQKLLDRSQQFLDGNLDVTGLPQYASQKSAADQAYKRARQQILAQSPGGGTLQDLLANAATGQAHQLTQAAGGIAQNELDWIRDYAGRTAPTISTQASGTAGGIQAQLSALAQQRDIAAAQLAAQQRGQDINALATQRGQDISQQTGLSDIANTLRGQDVTQRGQDLAHEVGMTNANAAADANDNAIKSGFGRATGNYLFGDK